ncbi:DUF4158 domain-containing protein [Actinacidiphila sp. bgisy160]|uniref:DUF4158 domain-containing protein n=1 Tax=Actinacidiphila sp. bgisy160 TaxID=3413796 RepID=UPI003D74B1D1
MRQDWKPEDLIEVWTLLEDDMKRVRNKSGATRLGFALLLKFFEVEARFPESAKEVPAAAVEYVAQQVKVPAGAWAEHDWQSKAIQRHRGKIRAAYGFRANTEADQHVIVVGGGNSGAQIAADLALDGHVEVTWVTQRPPRFLADDIDGRALFDVATARRRALKEDRSDTGGVASLGDIVAVPPVRAARDAGLLHAQPMFAQLTAEGVRWADGSQHGADAVIWCTGFRPALAHLAPLNLRGPRGHIPTDGTRALCEPRLHLLGYGDWTGPASATLIGVGRPTRDAARAVAQLL